MNADGTYPREQSDLISPLVCNIGYRNTSADERVDDNCCEWLEKG